MNGSVGMQWVPSDDQVLLREALQRWLEERYPFAERRRQLAESQGFSPEQWREFGELGWLAAGLPERHGGLGGGAVDQMLVAECLGAALWCGPWLECVVMGADLLAHSASPLAGSLLPALLEGRALLTCAFHESQSRYDLAPVATHATSEGRGWRLQGSKSHVAWANVAGHLLVSACVRQGDDDDGVGVFLVPLDAAGVVLYPYPSIDGRPLAEVSLADVRLTADALIHEPRQGLSMIERVCDHGAAALVAEAAGAMWTLYRSTLDHLKTRRQFGVALGSLQALQHRMVDVYADCEMARSMAWVAAHGAGSTNAVERARAVAAAKSRVGRSAVRVGQESVQLHGGMGMTDDLAVGHYFKRLTAINATLGDHAWHARRFRALAAASV